MSLKEKINEDMKSAMRSKDVALLGTIRLIQAAIKQKEVDERILVDDSSVISIIEKMLKQRNDSIEALDFDRSDDQKNSSFDEEPTSDSAQKEKEKKAAQNVLFQREFGTGLDTYKAMQDPNYVLGSGSALRQPARRLESKAGAMRRAARRLRRQGYGAAAQQMAAAGEMARLGQPSIDTPALRKQRMKQRIAASEEAAKQDKLTAGGIAGAIGDTGEAPKTVTEQRNEDFNARASGLDDDSAGRAAALKKAKDKKNKNGKFRDANLNGIEDRQEGIYLPEDYVND